MQQKGVFYDEPRIHAPFYVFDMEMFLTARTNRDDMLTHRFGPPAYVEFNYFWVNPETPRAIEMVLERCKHFAIWGSGDPRDVKAQWLYLKGKFDLQDPVRLYSDHDCFQRKHKFDKTTVLNVRDVGRMAQDLKWDTGYMLMLGSRPELTIPKENHYFITSWSSVLGGGAQQFSPVLTKGLEDLFSAPQMLPLTYDLSFVPREMSEAEKTHAWLVRNYVPVSDEQKDRRRAMKRRWTQRERKKRRRRSRMVPKFFVEPKKQFDEYEPECQ